MEELANSINKLMDTYKVFDDSVENKITERRAREELQLQRSAMISNMPQSLTKFEQKYIINIENAKLTSLVMFHPFQDMLATSDGQSIRLWSLQNGSKLMEIRNTHNYLGSMVNTSIRNKNVGLSLSNYRITGMKWINSGYESLLLVSQNLYLQSIIMFF